VRITLTARGDNIRIHSMELKATATVTSNLSNEVTNPFNGIERRREALLDLLQQAI